MLDWVGLTDEHEKVYRRLLAQPQLTAAELGTLGGASAAHVRTVLASLVDAGLAVRTEHAGPTTYAATAMSLGPTQSSSAVGACRRPLL